MRLGLLIAFTAAGLFAACSSMPEPPPTQARGDYGYTRDYVSWLIREAMDENDIVGLSIALVDDQQVVWAAGFGMADAARGTAATPDTVYRVGSVSKLFTATAAMQLAEQGRLALDRPVQEVLPGFAIRRRFDDPAPITARLLMTHHAGLPSDLLQGMWTPHPEPFSRNLERLREQYASFPPGRVLSYSNQGVTLLGQMIAQVAQRDFAAHMETTLLRPLGMEASHFAVHPDLSPRGARAYRKGEEVSEPGLRDVPAGGLNSSVRDLARFMQMVFAQGRAGERQILRQETLAQMLRPQNTGAALDHDFRIGLAWMLNGLGPLDAVGPVAYHDGATLYHRAELIVMPAHKLGVVVLANSSEGSGVVSRVARETLRHALRAKTGIRVPSRARPALLDGPVAPELQHAFAGDYGTPAGVVNIAPAGEGLRAQLMGNTLRLVPRADGRLGLQYRWLGLFPARLGQLDHVGFSRATVEGHEVLQGFVDGRRFLAGERLRPLPVPPAWLRRLGEYEVVNRGDDALLLDELTLRYERGLLIADYRIPLFFDGRMSVALAPLSATEAVTRGLGRGMGETLRVTEAGGAEQLEYSGYRLRLRRR